MKFQIEKENLLHPLQQIIGAVEKKHTKPSLLNVLIKTTKEGLTFTATDLEIELISQCHIVVDEQGETTVSARKLLDICKSLNNEAWIKITLQENKLLISSEKSNFSLTTLPARDFPALDTIDTIQTFEISQKILHDLIDKTAFAMAQQDVRYYLNGLMLEVSSNSLCAVATDGHRLAYCRKAIDYEAMEIKQIILPRKGVIELQRLLEDSDDTVRLNIAANHFQVEFKALRLTSKLIDGRFPDYNKVMPETTENIITTERESLRQALIRASILSNEKYRGIRMVLDKNLVRLQAQNPDQEEADIEVEVSYAGDAIEIGFNVNYMLDALSVTDATEVHISLRDSNSSFLLTYPNQPDGKYVIMPMRL